MKRNPNRPYATLKAWRQARQCSQHEAAAFLGISQGFYSKLERRSQALRGPAAKRIMQKTGVPLEILVGAA